MFDHRWLRQQYCDGGIATVHLFVALCKFAESRAGAIEQHLPTKRFAPALGRGALDTSIALAKVAQNQRRQRKYTALAVVIGAHDNHHILNRNNEHQRPGDQRQMPVTAGSRLAPAPPFDA